MDKNQSVEEMLERILEQQLLQLKNQEEALRVQREQFAFAQKQFERAEQLQDTARAAQERARKVLRQLSFFVPIAILIVILLAGYISWLLFRIPTR